MYILERKETDFNVFSYDPQDKELQKIDLDKSRIKINAKQKIESFFSIDNYLILQVAKKSEKGIIFFFDLRGSYLGTADFGKEMKMIAGTYNDYLYIYKRDKQDNQFIEIYMLKQEVKNLKHLIITK
ncbi:MAG: hypothetical protein K8S23_04850 [Candidatus Cloacimonetes bacterium]|nr:hypothetical protein [Candidatus Cloacimonadota bacterium]